MSRLALILSGCALALACSSEPSVPSVSAPSAKVTAIPQQQLAPTPAPPQQQAALEIPVPPIQKKMAAWAALYREQLAPVAAALALFEATPSPERAVCTQLITATYGAQGELTTAPDPDVESSVRRALEGFATAGSFCLQGNGGLQDTYLLISRGGAGLAESIMEERYGQAGVKGLAEPMQGGTEIGRRAIEYAESVKRP